MSNGRLRDEVIDYFASRFGVERLIFDSLQLEDRGDDVWAVSNGTSPNLTARRPAGLRILRRTPYGPKPTTAFLIFLADRVQSGRVELALADLEALLLGRTLETSSSDGCVAVSYRGDIVGCGYARAGALRGLIPTGRRRELLEALAEERSTESPNL